MSPPSACEATMLSALRHGLATKAASIAKTTCSAASSTSTAGARGMAAAAAPSAGAVVRATRASTLPQVVFAAAAAHGHLLAGHVEQPARVDEILRQLSSAGITSSAFEAQLRQLSAPTPAPLEAVREVHSYVDELRRLAEKAEAQGMPAAVADVGDPDGVTYVTGTSFNDALRAVGAATSLVDAVVAASRAQQAQQGIPSDAPAPHTPSPVPAAGVAGSPSAAAPAAAPAAAAAGGTAGFCITRPPGHHATADTPLGYCLFNNVAMAARHAQRAHGLAKVMILDFDLHHGNGTADIFASDPSVLFIDAHEDSSIYPPPYSPAGASDIGEGPGLGTTVNVPLPRYAGEVCVLSVFDSVIAPAARRFRPELILVSAGFDAHWRDPFQQLQFRSGTYHKLATRLRSLAGQLCGGRLLFLLEGGYHTEAVGESVCEVFLALLGRPSVEAQAEVALPHPEPVQEVESLVQQLRQIHGLQ